MKILPTTAMLAFVFTSGCGSQSEINEYVIEPQATYTRVTTLLKSEYQIPFDWDAPASWKTAPNDEFSTAAWTVEAAQQTARITLTQLGAGMDIPQQIVRWRDQIGAQGKLTDGLDRIEVKGIDPAIYIDISGKKEAILGLMINLQGELWIFKFRGELKVSKAERSAFRKFCESLTIVQPEEPLLWTTPEGWTEAANDQFSVAAWTAGQDDRTARITITELGPRVAKATQIERWRGQIQASSDDEKPVVAISKQYAASSGMVELTGPTESILGFMMSNEQALWVVKLRGPVEVAKIERDRFQKFCESLTLDLGLH